MGDLSFDKPLMATIAKAIPGVVVDGSQFVDNLVTTGVSDDVIIQKAIDGLPPSGGEVLLTEGTYTITSPIKITKNNVSIRGMGAGATTIQAASGSESITMFQIGDNVNTLSPFRLSDMLITSVNQKTGGYGIQVQKGFKIFLERLRIEKQYNAVYIFNTTATWFSNTDIRNTSNNGITWENTLGSGYDLYLNNILMDNPDVTNGGSGLYWLGGENFVIQNCDVEHYTQGFLIAPAASHQSRFGFFTNAEFDTNSDNNIKISSAGGDIVGLTFTNCWTGTGTNYGFLVDGGSGGLTQGIRVIGHKSFHNGLAGIRLAGGQDLHLTGCDLAGNSQTSANTRSGIEIASGVGSDVTIVDCNSKNGYQQGTTQSYGLSMDAGTYTNLKIAHNDFSTNTNGAINLNGAIGNPGNITYNIGYNPIGLGTISPGTSSPFTYTAGMTHETVYLYGGTVQGLVTSGGTVRTSAPANIDLDPQGTIQVFFTSAPTMIKLAH